MLSAAKNQHLRLICSALKGLLQGWAVLVGAASAAKLLFRTVTLVDKWVLVVKSTSVVDLFVPKQLRWGNTVGATPVTGNSYEGRGSCAGAAGDRRGRNGCYQLRSF
jgi:hypothetical protein